MGYFTVVCLVTWPLTASEAEGDLALIQTSLIFSCQWKLVSIRITWFTQQKQWGLYQNKVTSSLAAIQRPGHWKENCKMVYWQFSYDVIKIVQYITTPFFNTSNKWHTFLNTKGSSSYTGLMALFGTILVLYFLLTVSAGKPNISTSTYVPTFLSDSHWPEIIYHGGISRNVNLRASAEPNLFWIEPTWILWPLLKSLIRQFYALYQLPLCGHFYLRMKT